MVPWFTRNAFTFGLPAPLVPAYRGCEGCTFASSAPLAAPAVHARCSRHPGRTSFSNWNTATHLWFESYQAATPVAPPAPQTSMSGISVTEDAVNLFYLMRLKATVRRLAGRSSNPFHLMGAACALGAALLCACYPSTAT